jgi:hypothetical protein
MRTPDDVVAAVGVLRRLRPQLHAVVVKHDDSGAGDGNTVLPIVTKTGRPRTGAELLHELLALPDWYLDDLRRGGVVEELVRGEELRSPSCQVDLLPDGSVAVLATHEQVLGGDNGQVFQGCRFPADAAYAGDLARHAVSIGQRLAAAGVSGRASVDFVAVRDHPAGWRVFALEVNVRKGGTSHPYSTLRNLVPGRYEAPSGTWLTHVDDTPRAYIATDNFVDTTFNGLDQAAVIRAVRNAGVQFDHRTQTGVVLHMLAGLGIDGRFGYTALGRNPDHAADLEARTRAAVHALVTNHDQPSAAGPPEQQALRAAPTEPET